MTNSSEGHIQWCHYLIHNMTERESVRSYGTPDAAGWCRLGNDMQVL